MPSIRDLFKKTNTQTGLGAGLNLNTWDDAGTFTTGVAFDGNDSKFIIPKVTTAVRTATTPLEGEFIYDSDEDLLYYGDGTTVGGIAVGAGASSYSALTDVDTTGLATGQTMVWNGTVWVPGSGGREVLTADRTYYVRTDGSDSNDGLTNTAGGAFLTIQKAIDIVAGLDLHGFTATISISDGIYTNNIITKPLLNGGCIIEGNTSNRSLVIVQSSSVAITNNHYGYTYKDFTLRASSGNPILILVLNQSFATISGVVFGSVNSGVHIYLTLNSGMEASSYFISGGADRHCVCELGSVFRAVSITVTITNTPAFATAFYDGTSGGGAAFFGTTFTGSATGKRYQLTSNGFCFTNGAGANFLPGSIDGTTATGGQYA